MRCLENRRAVERGRIQPENRCSFPSVRETLVHIMGAEWIWLRRWKGTSPPALLSAADFPDLDSIKARWPEIEGEQMDFVAQITDASLKEPLKYVNLKGRLTNMLLGGRCSTW